MSKVLVSCTTLGTIHKSVVFVLLELMRPRGHQVKIILPTHVPFENALSHVVNDFMAGDFDYWLHIDADNPPTQNPLDLIDLDKDIMGMPTPVWHFMDKEKGERPIYHNAYDYVRKADAYKEHLPREGLQRVDAVGTGCLLIARRVFECDAMRNAPFMRTWNPDGTVDKGNDLAFCERARANGFEIWAHYDYPCNHFVTLPLNEVTMAFNGLMVDG